MDLATWFSGLLLFRGRLVSGGNPNVQNATLPSIGRPQACTPKYVVRPAWRLGLYSFLLQMVDCKIIRDNTMKNDTRYIAVDQRQQLQL